MDDKFKKLFVVTDAPQIELAEDLKKLLHTELTLGMTRWVCRHGTLGEGFEKLTDAQKYYQSLREVYTRSVELKRLKARVKEAYADFLDAQDLMVVADTESKKLRAQAKIEMAEITAGDLLVTAEDTLRQLDEFNKIRLELQDKVRAEFPGGIEQAEPHNWLAVLEYRASKQACGGGVQDLASIPLPVKDKMLLIEELQKYLLEQGENKK